MTLRRLIFTALMALCFDAVVPLEVTPHGTLAWENDEQEAVRAGERRLAAAAEQRAVAPRPAVTALGLVAARRRIVRPSRRRRVRRLAYTAAPASPALAEDH